MWEYRDVHNGKERLGQKDSLVFPLRYRRCSGKSKKMHVVVIGQEKCRGAYGCVCVCGGVHPPGITKVSSHSGRAVAHSPKSAGPTGWQESLSQKYRDGMCW
ncbi:serine/threonine-protein phosphatase 2A 56 kDa regulatory subunit epsilon isoform-like [Platysternon megacephalum]|uniref:Serine/threonine-protein phosphatase 2A 56 kDa regulatory subunit epsilon isoform-like n=1 Tax=Platysternon megacephalum TaxID=55544 RepID=A0A4D9EWX7_9SAUR|nr:serine/threonine-protein phosphatase 2A 56 kDa regulatory subunit epsilon isoform-like [Platysternon megacephalum]